MRVEIEIPVEFESDYTGDKFKDFFSRVLCDIKKGVLCDKYEEEIAEMFIVAFDKSKPAYDVEKTVAELEEETEIIKEYEKYHYAVRLDKAIDIVKKGGAI